MKPLPGTEMVERGMRGDTRVRRSPPPPLPPPLPLPPLPLLPPPHPVEEGDFPPSQGCIPFGRNEGLGTEKAGDKGVGLGLAVGVVPPPPASRDATGVNWIGGRGVWGGKVGLGKDG